MGLKLFDSCTFYSAVFSFLIKNFYSVLGRVFPTVCFDWLIAGIHFVNYRQFLRIYLDFIQSLLDGAELKCIICLLGLEQLYDCYVQGFGVCLDVASGRFSLYFSLLLLDIMLVVVKKVQISSAKYE